MNQPPLKTKNRTSSLEFDKQEPSDPLKINPILRQNDSNNVNWPKLQTLKANTNTNTKKPRNSQDMEPLLPEDDTAAFFRTRAVIEHTKQHQTRSAVKNFARGLFAFITLCALIYFLFPGAKTWTNHLFTKSKILTTKQVNKGKKTIGDKSPSSSEPTSAAFNIFLSPAVQLAKSGNWIELSKYTNQSCQKWEASDDCLKKAYFNLLKGRNNNLKVMQKINIDQSTTLKPHDKLLWNYILNISQPETKNWPLSLQGIVAKFPKEQIDILVHLSDEGVKNLLKQNKTPQASALVSFFKNQLKFKQKAYYFAKWDAFISGAQTFKIPPNTLSVISSDLKSLFADSLSANYLTPMLINQGTEAKLAKVISSNLTKYTSLTAGEDPERWNLQAYTRILWSTGKRQDAMKLVFVYAKLFGNDGFSNHFNFASTMYSSNRTSLTNAANDIQKSKAMTAWESYYVAGMIYIKLNRINEAETFLKKMNQPNSTNGRLWKKILQAEIMLAKKQAKQVESLMLADKIQIANHWYGMDVLRRSYDLQDKVSDSTNTRTKMDLIKGNPGYMSSQEILRSPMGPLALWKAN
ncbi:MAG: hypothetical protein NT027_04390 [Proteobacteria bacterium]|nr:hypothetical protein [Pseudomonadota bacterium]